MKVLTPTVGPIVGYTGPDHTRIFLRGKEEHKERDFRRCFGVVRWRQEASKSWSKPLFNKLSPNFDMTGVFVLSDLTPQTRYEYQAGWFYADSELDRILAMDEEQLEWPLPSTEFKTSLTTGTDDAQATRHFIVGSCRYLLRLFGGTWFDDRGDKIFRTILEQIERNMPVNALLMIGDQIYADDLNFIFPDTQLDQFFERYRQVFSQRHIQRLMARVPTYMILDDHEIQDNWPSKCTGKDRLTLYPKAIHAYQIYQCSHSPVLDTDGHGRLKGTPTRFWYSFTDGCADWFVMDTRTERIQSNTQTQIVSDWQLKEVLDWLNDGSGKVKLVVTSVPLFPDLSSDAEDKWSTFAAQRNAILEHIRSRRIRKVVFVSGDVHCSFTSELRLPDDPDFLVHCIISSSFFWPYPHMSESAFLFGQPLRGTGSWQYTSKRTSPVHSDDNFARIEVNPSDVKVTFFARKGERLGKVVRLAL